jgi:hypothetical protein
VERDLKETALVQQVLSYLLLKGHYVWRNNTGATRAGQFGERFIRYGLPGSADVLGCAKDGKLIAVECKIKPCKPTPLQLDFLEQVQKRGGYAILAYSLTDVEKVL